MMLQGRTALVTGGSRNIGRAIAYALAEQGSNVIICARHWGEMKTIALEIEKLGVSVMTIIADVSNPSQVEHMVEQGMQKFGKIDILVNNVGIRATQFILDISYEDWDSVIRTNLTSAFYCIKAVIPGMLKQKYGRIINISGRSGFEGKENRAHVIASKAGLHGLTKALAHDVSAHGITVNTVAPGLIDTERDLDQYPEFRDPEGICQAIPMRRFGLKSEVGKVVSFLASDMSSYVTGQVIHVNGGRYMV